MKIIYYKIDKIKVLKLIGELTVSETSKLNQIIKKILKEKYLAFDLSETTHINSFLLTILAQSINELRKKKGDIFVYYKKNTVFDVLDVVGFTKLIKHTDDYDVFTTMCKNASESL